MNFVPDWRIEAGSAPPSAIDYGHGIQGPADIGSSVVKFLLQVLDTMQNWRDNLQAELPGFRDRIQDIPLGRGEGGMNLAMSPRIIEGLVARGRRAGEVLVDGFPIQWERHRLTRYRSLMQLLQLNFNGEEGRRPGMGTVFDDLGLRRDVLADADPHLSPAWGRDAARATDELLRVVEDWGTSGKVDFATERPLRPPRILRVTPEV